MADNVRIGTEIAPPDFVTKDRDLFCARLVVLGRKVAALDRRDADDLEEVFGDIPAGVTLRIVLVGHVDGRSGKITSHHRKRLLRRFQIFVILRRRNLAEPEIIVLIARLGINQPDADQLLRMRKREAAQDDRVDHGELRGRTADAESEHEDGQKTKRFLFK